MNAAPLSSQTTAELVEKFRALGEAKGEATLEGRIARYNRLYWQLDAVEEELKGRNGDQRRELARFYTHPAPQLRLDAAYATLAIFPEQAQAVLQRIVDRGEFPQAANALHTLMNIKEGTRIPE
ncbi:DUF2019 domain-containing protein [Jatrophihabitans sp.]|jgi:hypothetical protein|uniref:DUF2019 domain-containing protein n=1 Tax=Jatrophihabitans sp. TaxID=1932789 RepID=UPI0030C6D842|nr:hypothetical protein [Jatrophihabitans sp.]MDB5654292.1 hypothetical protein [Tardiphaga sp.]